MSRLFYLLLTVALFSSSASFAGGTLSGTNYSKPVDLDTKLPADLHADLPDLGDVSQTVLSAQDEQRIAEQILAEVAVSDEVLQDAEIQDYLQALGNRLAAASDDKRQTFHFLL